MIEFIAHRINTLNELKQIPNQYGVEIDLRDFKNKIILSHDPYIDGEDFESFLKNYNHGTLILNIKSERIELEILELLKKYQLENYFFLDSSFPMIHQLSSIGEQNIAIRFSEYEGLDTILNMRGKVKWVWIDCFSKIPIDQKSFQILKANNFNLCFVSPDLQNQEEKIYEYSSFLKKNKIFIDAVCVKYKNINKWI
mgnify:CR=1 FL=1